MTDIPGHVIAAADQEVASLKTALRGLAKGFRTHPFQPDQTAVSALLSEALPGLFPNVNPYLLVTVLISMLADEAPS